MDIQSLKTSLATVMPILNANLAAAHKEYMDGDITAGAFGYVRSRHESASAVLSRDDIKAEDAYKACALLAIDLRTGVKEVADKAAAEAQVEVWWQCYRNAGFTEVNKLFGAPMLPDGAVRM